MKFFSTKQIAGIDRYTIQNEPIADIDLMERASLQIANWVLSSIQKNKNIVVFAGPGNNGGDAMAVARMLAEQGYIIRLYLIDFGKALSGSPAINWQRLIDQKKVNLSSVKNEKDFPGLTEQEVVIDGIFGSGLSRPLEGVVQKLVVHINSSKCRVVAIDIPSGLFGEDNSTNDLAKVLQATNTLTLQFPKLSFFFAEHAPILGNWEVLPIGLHPRAMDEFQTPYYLLNEKSIAGKISERTKFSHKGTYGHALLVAGSYGKMGAAILSAKASLRSGCGLLTSHLPRLGYEIMQTTVPEAMCSIDASDLMFTEFPALDNFSSVGIGPGLGTKTNTCRALKKLLASSPKKMVLDADALNILSKNKDWLKLLPENAILTPHPKEFERLAGESPDSYSQLQLLLDFSEKYKVIVVLKGACTRICMPDRRVFFNITGNPGMATAGSGDVLTGIILGLLAQSYSPENAALLGVYLHGLAGDLAAKDQGEYSIIAGDIISKLGSSFLMLKN